MRSILMLLTATGKRGKYILQRAEVCIAFQFFKAAVCLYFTFIYQYNPITDLFHHIHNVRRVEDGISR